MLDETQVVCLRYKKLGWVKNKKSNACECRVYLNDSRTPNSQTTRLI